MLSFIPSSDARKRPATRTTRLRLEPLEERAVPAFVISEILFNPPGGAPNEYVEIRATNNETTTPSNFFLIQVEGDSGQNPGDVRAIFNLSNINLIGTNRFLLLLQGGNSYTRDPNAQFGVGANGFIGLPGNSFLADGGINGFELGSSTFMLVQTPSNNLPSLSTDLDPNNNGTLTLPSGWTVPDSIGVLNGDAGDHAYAPVAFALNGVGTTNTGSGPGTLVSIPFTPTYVERLGNRTGTTQDDWVASAVALTSQQPNFFSLGVGTTAPGSFDTLPLDNIGSANKIEFTAPSVSTITNNTVGGTVPLNGVVTYTITFSEAIDPATVVLSDFVNGATTNPVTNFTILSATQSLTDRRILTVQVQLKNDGNFRLRLLPGVIADPAGNQFATTFTDSQVVTVDSTPPTVTAIDDGDADNLVPVNQPVTYTITFSEAIDPASFISSVISNAGTASITVGAITQTASNVFTVQVTPTSGGTLRLRLNTGAGSVTDLAGNPLAASAANPDNDTLTVDATPPTVTSIVDDDADNLVPVNQPVTYTITFADPDDGIHAASFTSSDITNAGTASIIVGRITPVSGTVFTVQVTPTSGGTLRLSLPAGAVTDVAGNGLSSPALDDDTLTVDAAAPFVVQFEDDKPNNAVKPGVPVTYGIAFSEAIDPATLSTSDFVNAVAGGAPFTASNLTQISPTLFTVQITPSTEGNLLLSLPAGAVTDIAGNPLSPAAFAREVISVDGTPPVVVSIDDGDADNIATVGRTLNYVVTFNETIDNATVSASAFTNAGTATVTIGAITQVAPGVFTVQVTPTTAGTLQLQVTAGTLADLAGNLQAVNGLDNDTLSIRDAAPDTTPPEVVVIGFDTGTIVPAGTTVTYSITFDETVNAASIHAGSFINAGTAAIAIGAIGQPAANVITVQVTPTTTGTMLLALPAGLSPTWPAIRPRSHSATTSVST